MTEAVRLQSAPEAASWQQYEQALVAVQRLRRRSRFCDRLLLLEAVLLCCLEQPQQMRAVLGSQPTIGLGLRQRLAAEGAPFGLIAGQPLAVWSAWLEAQCAALMLTPNLDITSMPERLVQAAGLFQAPSASGPTTVAATAAAGCAAVFGKLYPTRQALETAAEEMRMLVAQQKTLAPILAAMPVWALVNGKQLQALDAAIQSGLHPSLAAAAYKQQAGVYQAQRQYGLAVRAYANLAVLGTVRHRSAPVAEAYHE